MKIAILSPFYPYRGGIAQFSNSLYKALEKEEAVKAFSFSRLYPDFLFPGKTQYVETANETLVFPVEQILDSIQPFSYGKTVKAIREFQPDVLIIAYWMSFFVPAYFFISNRLKKKIKIIALIHNAIPHEARFFDRALARLFFKQCHRFVVLSQAVEKDLLQIMPDARFLRKTHPLYDHFGTKIERMEAFSRLKLDTNKKTLLFFGLIRDYKGLDLLIEAMTGLDDSYQLVIAGESYGSFEKYDELIAQSSARNRIRVFNHYIDDTQVPEFFSVADILILPYRSASQSGVISIACHFEVPILATDVGGLKEIIEQTGIGLVCRPSVNSLTEGIQNIFQSDRSVFIDSIQKEKKALSWEAFANAVAKFIETL